jgi:hypothetical protein
MLVGDAISAAACGAKDNPVIAPPALTLTSAVACCHHGFLAEGNKLTSFPIALWTVDAEGGLSRHADSCACGR